jgi:preprotein translocase subunit SecF
MEFFKKVPAFPFMRLRKGWYALSALLVVVSIGSLFVRGLNFGVDFTGGVTIQATFPQSPDLNAIRAGIEGLGYAEPQVQNFGSSRDVAVRRWAASCSAARSWRSASRCC